MFVEVCAPSGSCRVLHVLVPPPVQIIQGYISDLLTRHAWEEAAGLSVRLLRGNAVQWERWVYMFAQVGGMGREEESVGGYGQGCAWYTQGEVDNWSCHFKGVIFPSL